MKVDPGLGVLMNHGYGYNANVDDIINVMITMIVGWRTTSLLRGVLKYVAINNLPNTLIIQN